MPLLAESPDVVVKQNLSKQWQEKIALSYKNIDTKLVSTFLNEAKKSITEKLPQSLIATSLIQYGNNVHG